MARMPGLKNYCKDELTLLLAIVQEILPTSPAGWRGVAEEYNARKESSWNERSSASLHRKFTDLASVTSRSPFTSLRAAARSTKIRIGGQYRTVTERGYALQRTTPIPHDCVEVHHQAEPAQENAQQILAYSDNVHLQQSGGPQNQLVDPNPHFPQSLVESLARDADHTLRNTTAQPDHVPQPPADLRPQMMPPPPHLPTLERLFYRQISRDEQDAGEVPITSTALMGIYRGIIQLAIKVQVDATRLEVEREQRNRAEREQAVQEHQKMMALLAALIQPKRSSTAAQASGE